MAVYPSPNYGNANVASYDGGDNAKPEFKSLTNNEVNEILIITQQTWFLIGILMIACLKVSNELPKLPCITSIEITIFQTVSSPI